MIIIDEYSNALATLDLQYREGAYPLDKKIVVMLARFFSSITISLFLFVNYSHYFVFYDIQ